MTAKDSLAHALNVIAALNEQFSSLKCEYARFQQMSKEADNMVQEEILSIRCAYCIELLSQIYEAK